MPTNRKRTLRTSRRRPPAIITPEYIQRLKLRDFMGTLTEEEIPIAREHGVYRFDAWAKVRNGRGSRYETAVVHAPETRGEQHAHD